MPDGGDVQRRVGTVAHMSLEQAARTESCEGDHALQSLSGLEVLGRPLRGKNLGNLLWRLLVQTMGASRSWQKIAISLMVKRMPKGKISPRPCETCISRQKRSGLESAEVAYDADNRGSDLRSLRSWSDPPPDLQEHPDNEKG